MRPPKTRKNTQICFYTGSVIMAILGLSQTAMAEDNLNQGRYSEQSALTDTSFHIADPKDLTNNEVNLVFIRPLDNDGLQTTANIGIDGRFHASLQPGNYSQVRYCSGQHNISVSPTGLKTNDLTNTYSHIINFEAQQNHYIYVDIDDATGKPKLSKLEPEYAEQLLANQSEQTNQVSRVIADCPPVVQPEPEPEPEIKVEMDKPINLEVLFEFDKAVVQPVFNQRIEAVAKFMNKHPDATTVIEGHTDSVGRDSYNMDLSKRRAEAVKQELVTKYGIAPNRLQTQGYGETHPVDTNSTPEGRYKNRRVVATVSVKK